MIDLEELAAPFPDDRISWRIGSTNAKSEKRKNGPDAHPTKGIALAYIDARDVMDRFDEVCKPHNWQATYSHAGQRVICQIGVKLGDEWIWKANGAGDTQVEADKGAISDAFKRSAVLWGVGRYLYSIENKWVDLAPFGRIKDDQYPILSEAHMKAANNQIWGSRAERIALKAHLQSINSMLQTADDVRLWRESNQGMTAQLRKAQREQVEKALERVLDRDKAAAA